MSAEPLTPNELVNPTITSGLRSDYEALQNDLHEATQYAVELQKELAGKSNEFAQFKQLFAKTQEDLARLNAGIIALRQERHRLANEAMRATFLEMKLKGVTEERDQHLKELAESQAREEKTITLLNQRDVQVAELTMQLMFLKQERAGELRPPVEARSGAREPKSAAAERASL